MCFKGERTKEESLYTEIQGQCEGKMIPSVLPAFSFDFAAQDLYTALSCHKSPHQPLSLFMIYPFQLRCDTLSPKLIPFSCLSRHGIWPWGSEPLKWALRKKKSDHVALSRRRWKKKKQKKNQKNPGKPTYFFCSCARKKLNQSLKGCQSMRQSQRKRQNQKRM